MVYLSLDVNYGWEGKMCRDIIQVNYNGHKRETYFTIKLKNPGIGSVIEKLVQFITSIHIDAKNVKNPLLKVLEKLSEKFGLQYDPEEVSQALAKFNSG